MGVQTTKAPQLIFSNIGNKNEPAKNSVEKPHGNNNKKKQNKKTLQQNPQHSCKGSN